MTPSQYNNLEEEAARAVGRAEMRCQFAMADIYKAAGLLPRGVEIPDGPRDLARFSGSGLIVEWLADPGAGGAYFDKVAEAAPGDLLCFQLGRIPHHVAISLVGGRLVHVFGRHGIQIAACIPPEWARRIHSAWRIKT